MLMFELDSEHDEFYCNTTQADQLVHILSAVTVLMGGDDTKEFTGTPQSPPVLLFCPGFPHHGGREPAKGRLKMIYGGKKSSKTGYWKNKTLIS